MYGSPNVVNSLSHGKPVAPERVIDAWFDLADTIVIVGVLIRRTWITHHWATHAGHPGNPTELHDLLSAAIVRIAEGCYQGCGCMRVSYDERPG